MNSTKKHAPLFHIGDWVAFQYGPEKVSAKVLEDRGRLGVGGRRIYRVQPDAELEEASAFEMPEDALESIATPVRQSYRVRYIRQGKANVWRAVTTREGLLRGVKAKGAVGYSTAMWEGGPTDHQGHVIVPVLLEVDPHSCEPDGADGPDHQRGLVEQARGLADEMFRSRHSRAKIEHAPYAD
jgi:hypothetical protein